MAYKNGIANNNAANAPFLYKNGLQTSVNLMDTAVPNNWQEWSDNPDADGKLPTVIGADADGVTQLNNPNGANALALSTTQISTPATPTITNAGTAASTAYSYKVVAWNGQGVNLGHTPASAAGSTSTGAATLSTTNYNTITFTPVEGAAYYTVFRTASSGTPSSTGEIGTVPATINTTTGAQPTSYTFDDTGIAGDSTTAPTTNTTGAVSFPVIGGGFSVPALATPAGGAVSVDGTAGSTTITYKVVALAPNGGHSAASASITTTTANATLSSTNSNTVTWDPVSGASGYQVWRTAAGGTPSSTGLVGTVGANVFTFTDTGIAGDSATAPTTNTTGGISVARLDVSGASVTAQGVNYVTAGGSNNAWTATLTDKAGTAIPLAAGLTVLVFGSTLTLQAGANTFNLNGGGAVSVKKASAPTVDLATAIAANGIVLLAYNGTSWLQIGA